MTNDEHFESLDKAEDDIALLRSGNDRLRKELADKIESNIRLVREKNLAEAKCEQLQAYIDNLHACIAAAKAALPNLDSERQDQK